MLPVSPRLSPLVSPAARVDAAERLRRLLAIEPAPRADLGALSAELSASAWRTSTVRGRLLRRLGLLDSAGPAVLELLGEHLTAAEAARVLDTVPALEPRTRGPACAVPAARPVPGRAEHVRQGRLGDCWFIAVLAACEHAWPGFIASLLRPLPNGLVQVRLHTPLPRWITLSDRVPPRHRAGDRRLRPNGASLVEKALAIAHGRGSYRRTQFNFAGTAFRLLTGRWCPARPVPRTLRPAAAWLGAGRPVLASTLIRPGGSFMLHREDDPDRSIAFMDGHVYVVMEVASFTEDGCREPGLAPRVHVRNPHGGAEGEPRRTDLYLSAAQFRRAFISVNVGPRAPAAP
ncbi:hypothetical protein GCM10022261_23220 [Brevibacterium daeguense]|uniref:Calpain catalytic domain-containing protein n=1 Tax=Brevibacterium daeguense TaxID=909936 RepID=A0ABP8ELG7_9MICO|nr:C2 family cysteine protease [Brevibacterium daeguense]